MSTRKLFVHISVRDLQQSMDFFSTLGFTFNKQFTDAKAACMVVNDDAYFMLPTEPIFRTFTSREQTDTSRVTESMFALSCDSGSDVDAPVRRASHAGVSHAKDPISDGFMYGWT